MLQTPEEDTAYLDPRQENEELLRRLAEVQQQMWTLEEKVMIHITNTTKMSFGIVSQQWCVLDNFNTQIT